MQRVMMAVTAALALGACGDDDGQSNNQNQGDAAVIPVCGNGAVESGEECDDGAANSDVAPDACRTNCVRAACGDGVRDTSEQCDAGSDNSDLYPDACRRDCTPARCGDGVIDATEICDEGAANSDSVGGACRADCVPAACEDGVYDPGQVCFRYFGHVFPYGYLGPMDLTGDGRDELVGVSSDGARTLLRATAEATRIARAQRHLIPVNHYPMLANGHLGRAGVTRDLLAGSKPALLAGSDATGRIALPTAMFGQSRVGAPGQLHVAGASLAGGRALVTLDFEAKERCAVVVDAEGYLAEDSYACADVAEALDGFVTWSGESTRPVAMPTASGELAWLFNGLHGPFSIWSGTDTPDAAVLRFSASGTLAGVDHYDGRGVVDLPSRNWIGPAARDGSDLYRVVIEKISPGDYKRVRLQRWDAEAQTLEPVATAPTVENTLYGAEFISEYTMGRFGGVGAYRDLLITSGMMVQLFRFDGATYQFVADATCLQAPIGHSFGVAAADLDGNGQDELILVDFVPADPQDNRLVIRWNVEASSVCGAVTTYVDLPLLPTRIDAAHLDGDAYPDLLMATTSSAAEVRGGMVLHGGANPWLEILPLTDLPGQLVPFPRAASPRSADLAFLFEPNTSSESGEFPDSRRSLLGLVRLVNGRYETGRLLQAQGESAPFTVHTEFSGMTDLDGDGVDDLVLVEDAALRLHVFRGPVDATGLFAAHDVYALPYLPGMAFLHDLTGEGRPDLVLIRSNPMVTADVVDAYVTVLENRTGAFDEEPRRIPTLDDPGLVALGDLNHDDRTDLVTVHVNAGILAVLLQRADGSLADPVIHGLPGDPTTATILDLDGDGDQDLVVAAPDQGMGPLWLRGDGLGGFAPVMDLDLVASEFVLQVGHVTDAAARDLVVTKYKDGIFSTLVLEAIP